MLLDAQPLNSGALNAPAGQTVQVAAGLGVSAGASAALALGKRLASPAHASAAL